MSENITDIDHPSVVLASTWIVFGSIGAGFKYLLLAILFVLHLLYRPAAFLLQPLVYLARFVLACLALPYHVLVKLETIYIYLGVAAIVGVLGGLLIRTLNGSLQSVLHLDHDPPPKGRTVKQYRQEKRKRDEDSDSSLVSKHYSSPGSGSPGYLSLSEGSKGRRRQRSLLAQTIMEEEDSEF